MRPRIVIHNALSLDGRMDWFRVDLRTYYQLAAKMKVDAILAGSDTLLAFEGSIPEEGPQDVEVEPSKPDDPRPILVVPDSRGRIRTWHWWRRQQYWRGVVVLVSSSTPTDYIQYLDRLGIEHIMTGEEKVSLGDALEELNARYDVKKLRVDSGGTLNGVLLREGLVDEVSVLIHPFLVGGMSPKSLFKAPDLDSEEGVIELKLSHLERLKNDLVWVLYEVMSD
jgi:2,5-diamino-6-(ribosylamino)-4(3H)-pyrimidinone 5'-phosphate reductase